MKERKIFKFVATWNAEKEADKDKTILPKDFCKLW